MTANQIAWWNIQENIRSHMQNELNTRNANSITSSLGNESNRISNRRMENDFVLGKQGNEISQQQADTASRKATQDYDIGLKNVANTTKRNQQDYEIGTTSNKIKAQDVANNFVIGTAANKNQSIRNAQDFALGKLQQESNKRQADAAIMKAGVALSELSPSQVVVALSAPTAQRVVDKVEKKAEKIIEKKVATVVNNPKKLTANPHLKPKSKVNSKQANANVVSRVSSMKTPLKGRPH